MLGAGGEIAFTEATGLRLSTGGVGGAVEEGGVGEGATEAAESVFAGAEGEEGDRESPLGGEDFAGRGTSAGAAAGAGEEATAAARGVLAGREAGAEAGEDAGGTGARTLSALGGAVGNSGAAAGSGCLPFLPRPFFPPLPSLEFKSAVALDDAGSTDIAHGDESEGEGEEAGAGDADAGVEEAEEVAGEAVLPAAAAAWSCTRFDIADAAARVARSFRAASSLTALGGASAVTCRRCVGVSDASMVLSS